MVKILLLMLLCHIIDDFVLQPVCLSKLKQKKTWEELEDWLGMYEHDYIMALFIHALSWAIMIHLPVMFMTDASDVGLFISVVVNMLIHAVTDNAKANKRTINLVADQGIHFSQIIITCLCFTTF
jgi:hypothetical protein